MQSLLYKDADSTIVMNYVNYFNAAVTIGEVVNQQVSVLRSLVRSFVVQPVRASLVVY